MAIVGSDLSAVILAHLLSSEHELNTVLISAKQSMEDFRKGAEEHPISIDESLDFFPADEKSEEALAWLAEKVLGESVAGEIKETIPSTFESGEFKKFVGFGERKLTTIDAVEYYLQQRQQSLTLSPNQWVDLLLKQFKGEVIDRAQPTQILVEEGHVKALVINETKRIEADRFIFCGSSRDLLELVPQDVLPGRVRQKIAKAKLFHRLNLNLTFSEDMEHQSEIHVLMGTKDDFEPVIGQFQYMESEEGQKRLTSSWTYLMNNDEYEDPESMTSIVKYMKRQIKRAYPEAFEVVASESISVSRDSHGHLDLEDTRVKGIDNFFIGSSHLGDGQSHLAKITAAKRVYDQFFS